MKRSSLWMLSTAVAICAIAAGLGAGGLGERNPVRTHPLSSSLESPQTAVLPIIVKLRAAGSTAAGAAQIQDAQVEDPHERIAALATRAGLALAAHREITTLMHVMLIEPLPGESAAETLARLRADPQVEYAEPDQMRYAHSMTPNDSLYVQQWYEQAPASGANATPSAVDATDAWSTTTGSNSIVIADIDSGVRPDHPDLVARLLPGYCFIHDAFIANNSSCPGPGATDPGDWITSTDISGHSSQCGKEMAGPSSWHGTRVAGILGAVTDNNAGIAGMTWNAQILPVRALGKCGGQDSDIISGMLWAAGIAVSGAPANSNPAKIINMSLGGSGACTASYQDAINQITAKGILIVASAGNEGGPVDTPGDCTGVAGVSGLRQAGTKVGYSSLGPQVALAAPAGNCGDAATTPQSACVYSLTTTTNLGYHQPDANDYTGQYYCDPTTSPYPSCSLANSNQYRTYNLGTSFSAPIVAGIAALMTAVNGKLNSCQLLERLKASSVPFPQTSLDATTQPPVCHVPSGSSDLQNAECICTNDGKTCGAGMANAPAALNEALRPIAAISLPAKVSGGQSISLDGSGSAAANNHSLSTFEWQSVSGGLSVTIQGANTSKAGLTVPSCGVGTVTFTVTDDQGRSDVANVTVTPTSLTTSAPATAGAGTCSVPAPAAVQVAVCPSTSTVQVSANETLTATVVNTTNAAVTWSVNGVAGGNATVGTISSAGVYTPPASVPSPATVTITAMSEASSSAVASAQVTVASAPKSGGGGGGALDWVTLLAAGMLTARAQRSRCALRS
ncbi:MAG TPA: S8 family serine peptidase [Steroidobacteraceae bacterium]|nr:S8 family serine peptidase [Steroidobacteraceae bacterium]